MPPTSRTTDDFSDESENLSEHRDAVSSFDGSDDDLQRDQEAAGDRATNGGSPDAAINEFHAEKLKTRRESWEINTRLAAISGVSIAVLIILATASYFYNSSAAAQTFRMRAEEAAANGDAAEESRWWSRYLMMVPDEGDVIAKAAYAADTAADQAEPDEMAKALTNARRRLSESLARLPKGRVEDEKEIRRRLIRRLLQSGGFWLKEAQFQIVDELGAGEADPFAHKALALSIYGQIQGDLYVWGKIETGPTENYWKWLSQQNPLLVMQRAVALLPDDLDCLAAFLGTVGASREFVNDRFELTKKQREWTAEQSRWMPLFDELDVTVSQALKRLQSIDSGRAQLTVYLYLSRGDADDQQYAIGQLLTSGKRLADRLALTQETSDEARSTEASTEASGLGASGNSDADAMSEQLVLLRRLSPEYWDYQGLLEAARLAAAISAGRTPIPELPVGSTAAGELKDKQDYVALANRWYDTLIDASVDDVTAKMRENTFLNAGIHAELQGDPDRALIIWKEGLDDVSRDNLELNGVIATRLARSATNDEEFKEAEEAIEAFGKAIDAERNRLVLSSNYELTQSQRNLIARVIELATWRFNVAGAELRIRRNGGTELTSEAILKLKNSLASSASVSPAERSQLAQNLAKLYSQFEVWDQAADAMTIASDLLPNNVSLHVAAGEAWSKAGNRSRAAEHWRMAGTSAELDVRVKAAQAEFEFQLRSPPAIRDLSGLRSTVAKLESEFNEKVQTGEGLPSDPQAIEQIETSIRILKMSLPPLGLLAEQHLASKQLAMFADELASEKLDNATIQAYAAERLAAVGMNDKANKRIKQFEELAGADSAPAAIIRARIDASNGKPVAAAKRLLKNLEKDPEMSGQLARLASNYYLAARDLNGAYQALKQVPKERLLPIDYYRLYRQAKQLALEKEDNVSANALVEEANQWRSQLKRIEEPEKQTKGVEIESVGTFWRMIEVEEKLAALQDSGEKFALKDARIIEIRELLEEITNQRPRWGRAISMQGYLAALLGNHEEALVQLRAGIEAGDRALRTRQLLLEQLITLNRDAEAEEEMTRMAMAVDFVVDPYAKQDIRSAFNRGELMLAVEAARRNAEKAPDNVTAQIVLSRVASTAVELDNQRAAKGDTKLTKKEKAALVEEARDAIQHAKTLSTDNGLTLAAAELDIEFRHGTPESVDKTWKRIAASDLPEHERLLLSARVLVSKGDIDGAIKELRESNKKRPSAATQLQLAKLFQLQGQSVDVVATLRDAVKLQPNNRKLRTELAKAIVVHEGENADWKEIGNLLRDGEGATAEDRFVYATLLSARGDGEQLVEALALARSLAQEQNSISYEASVLQVTILVKLLNRLDSEESGADTDRRNRYLEEARSMCNRLASSRSATAVDLYRNAAFLLNYGNEDDLERVKAAADQLARMPGGMLQSLELSMIFDQRSGDDFDASRTLESWMEKARPEQDRRLLGGVESAAGQALMKLGMVEEGLDWFEKAYEANEEALAPYVIALGKAQEYDKAASVCARHFKKHQDAASATLLAESLLATDNSNAAATYKDVLRDATDLHSNNVPLLEGVATLAMQTGEPEDAIKLYLRVLSREPLRLRALNNIAMAYAEVPGLASEGLIHIDRALKFSDRNPELLDTKGTVLFKASRHKEALAVFNEAIERHKALAGDDAEGSGEPRFLFHRILVLLALNRQQEARESWDQLDVAKLDKKGLTPEEQQVLEQMKSDFDAFATDQI